MNQAYQTCRICGTRVASGFTHCDGCYHKAYSAKAEEIKYLVRPFPIPAKPKTADAPREQIKSKPKNPSEPV